MTKKKQRKLLGKLIRAYSGMNLISAFTVARKVLQGSSSPESIAMLSDLLEVEDGWNGCSDIECCGTPIYMPHLVVKGRDGSCKSVTVTDLQSK
jgi:hypothetical protein